MEQKTSKAISIHSLSKDKIDLIKRTVCKGATDDELELFTHVCNKCGLDPFMKQIHAVKRGATMTIQTSIDGLRLIADRSGNYSPGREPSFEKLNGEMVSATAYVKKRTADGIWHEVSATAHFSEYKPEYASNFWKRMPHIMLSKCAEALALRKAFPAEMSGIYSDTEMDQAAPVEIEKETMTIEQCEEILGLIGEDTEMLARILLGYSKESLSQISEDEHPKIVRTLNKRKQLRAS